MGFWGSRRAWESGARGGRRVGRGGGAPGRGPEARVWGRGGRRGRGRGAAGAVSVNAYRLYFWRSGA